MLLLIAGLVSLSSVLGATTVTLAVAYYQQGRAADNDTKWGVIGEHSERLGKAEVRIDQHEYLIRALDVRQQLTEVQGDVKSLRNEMRILSERLRQKGF